MARISQLERNIPYIEDTAHIVVDREETPYKISGKNFKAEILRFLLQTTTEYSFLNLAGDFRPSATRGEFYEFGKVLLDEITNGLPVKLEVNNVSDDLKGWMFYDDDKVKIFFENGTSEVFEEDDDTLGEFKIYSWVGPLQGYWKYVTKFDIPGLGVKPSEMWNTFDLRNTWNGPFLETFYNQVSTNDISFDEHEITPTNIQTEQGNNLLLFGSYSSLQFNETKDFPINSRWTIISWVKPATNRTEIFLTGPENIEMPYNNVDTFLEEHQGDPGFQNGFIEEFEQYVVESNVTENNRITFNIENMSIDIHDDGGNSGSLVIPELYDDELHLLVITSDGTGIIKIYLDDEEIGTISNLSTTIQLSSLGAGLFSGILHLLYFVPEKAAISEIKRFYDKTKNMFEYNDSLSLEGFSESEVYGFSEEDVYGFNA